jgi:hypothetical protein
MLMWTLAFFSVSILLGFSFYRKYRARLNVDSLSKRYSRIGDYIGRPIHLNFDYRPEGSAGWESVDADVDEIYHYGNDYFLKGYAGAGRRGRVFKRSRMINLRIEAHGSELQSIEGLLVETDGDGSGSRAAA